MQSQIPPARNPTEPPKRTQTPQTFSAEHAFTLIACTAVLAAFTQELAKQFSLNLNSSSTSINFGDVTIPPTSIQEWIDRGLAVLEELKHAQ